MPPRDQRENCNRRRVHVLAQSRATAVADAQAKSWARSLPRLPWGKAKMSFPSIDALSLACATLGTVCMIAWPIFPNRRHMLTVQLGIAAGFGAHYWLEGAQTAALLNGLGLLHVLASLCWGGNPRLKWVGYAMIPAIAISCLASWSGLPSLFSGIGTMLIALGRVQLSSSQLRLFVLAGTPFWLVHDVMIGSPLFAADAISIAMGLYAMAGHARLARPEASLPPGRRAVRLSMPSLRSAHP